MENSTIISDPSLKVNLNTNSIGPACFIQKGKINCSTVIYKDKKTWRRSRHRVENEIQELKYKLEALKEIRRHLKNTRPLDEIHNKPNGSELTTFNDLTFQRNNLNIGMSNSPGLYRPMSIGNKINNKKRRRKPINVTTEVSSTNYDNYNTTDPENISSSTVATEGATFSPELVTNHHRHGHKVYNITQKTSTTTSPPIVVSSARTRKVQIQKPHRTDDLIPLPKRRVKPDLCHCDTYVSNEDQEKENKRRIKEERLKKKLRKQRKKEQLEKECGLEKMNCFHHDNDHWKTAPLWTKGPFCFCMNSNNNTYTCIRTINSTHNYLYCEFTTGFITYYNLRIDPFELQNRADSLKPEELSYLHDTLAHLMACKGRTCTLSYSNNPHMKTRPRANSLPTHTNLQQHFKRKKFPEDHGNEATRGVLQLVRSDIKKRDKINNSTSTRGIPNRKRRKT